MCGRRKWRRLWVGVSYFSTDWIFDKRLGTFFWFFSLYLTIEYNNLPPIKKKPKVNRFIIASRSLISLRASCSHTKSKHYLAMKTKHMSTTIHPEIYERGYSNRTLSPRQRIFSVLAQCYEDMNESQKLCCWGLWQLLCDRRRMELIARESKYSFGDDSEISYAGLKPTNSMLLPKVLWSGSIQYYWSVSMG